MFEQFSHSWQNWYRANDLHGPPEGLKASSRSLHIHMLNIKVMHKDDIELKQSEASEPQQNQPSGYCPCLYHQALSGTFENPDIFKEPGELFDQQLGQVQKQPRRH